MSKTALWSLRSDLSLDSARVSVMSCWRESDHWGICVSAEKISWHYVQLYKIAYIWSAELHKN